MVMPDRPADRLLQLAAKCMSGEFICVTPSLEVHVFLQAGRIAWATDSKHPFAFGSHLQETTKIDVEAFRHLVEECRRGRLPLGETLVEWGLASWDAVRASLVHQIRLAISLMASLPNAQTLFLERAYAPYNERLTFDLQEFLTRSDTLEDAAPFSVSDMLRPSIADRPGLAQQLRETIEGLSWVEILDGDRAIDAAPEAAISRVPEQLRTMLSDGADFVAIRSARGSMVGLSLPRNPRSLWCCLDADSTFGAIVSALWSMTVAAEDKESDAPPRSRGVGAWSYGENESLRSREIASFMHRAREIIAVLVLSENLDQGPVLACGSSDIDADRCVGLARRRAVSLTTWRLPSADACSDRLSSIGFYLRTMVTGDAELWCFGAEINPASGETLWLFVDRQTSQGLGWAYLAALTRALSRLDTRVVP